MENLTIKKIIVVSNKKEGPNSYLVMTLLKLNVNSILLL